MMHNSDPTGTRRAKGRPQAPFRIERLAVVTQRINEGMTFKEATKLPLVIYKYDFDQRRYVPDDEVNSRMPQTAAGRRTALHRIRREELADAARGNPQVLYPRGRPVPVPLAYRLDERPKRGRPKKTK